MPKHCTEKGARWCPNHGDCTCVVIVGMPRVGSRSMINKTDCPLHAPGSDHPSTMAVEGDDGRTYVDGRAIADQRRKVQVLAVLALDDNWRDELNTDPALSVVDIIGEAVLRRLRAGDDEVGFYTPPWTVHSIDVSVTR